MPRIYRTPLLDAIRHRLTIDGPQTSAEIAAILGRKPRDIAAAIAGGRATIVICAWQRSLVTGGRLKPVYDLRSDPAQTDARKPPKLSRKDVEGRYRDRHAARLRIKRTRRPAGPWDALLPHDARLT